MEDRKGSATHPDAAAPRGAQALGGAERAFRYRTRRVIVMALASRPGRPVSPRELAYSLAESQTNLSYHMRVLADVGALSVVGTKPTPSAGGSDVFYVLSSRRMRTKEVRSVMRRGQWRRSRKG